MASKVLQIAFSVSKKSIQVKSFRGSAGTFYHGTIRWMITTHQGRNSELFHQFRGYDAKHAFMKITQ